MFDDLIAANRQYATDFSLKGLPGQAAKGFALVTCIDTRIEPLAALGLVPGDAKVLRNAGGRVTDDVLRSLVLATHLLGVEEIAVMHHTRCALAGLGDEDIRAGLPQSVAERAGGVAFLAMPDPDKALADDVDTVRGYELLALGVRVEGWRYDVDSGRVLRMITA